MTAQPQDTPLQSHEVSQLYAIFTALPTGVLLLDGEGRITRANPAAKALLGEPLEGQAWRQIIDRCFQPREDDGHEISLRDGRRVQLSTQPLPDQPGQLVFINDLTETRQLQDRINHMKRLSALGNMAASLAHQIRTPLSAAMLYAANLANRTLKPESRSQFQQKLMARLQDLEKQISDILLFARNGDNQVVTPTSVQGLLAEVQAGAEAFCSQQGCELHMEAPGPISACWPTAARWRGRQQPHRQRPAGWCHLASGERGAQRRPGGAAHSRQRQGDARSPAEPDFRTLLHHPLPGHRPWAGGGAIRGPCPSGRGQRGLGTRRGDLFYPVVPLHQQAVQLGCSMSVRLVEMNIAAARLAVVGGVA